MSVQNTHSWNRSVRDGGYIPRVSRGQSRDGGHLQVRRGLRESRCRPERSGASRWEKTGTVVLGSESNCNHLAFCAAVTAQIRDLLLT